MAKKTKLGLTGAEKMFAPDTVHTIELPDLFARLRMGTSHFEMSSVTRSADEWNGGLTWNQSLDAAQFGKWDAPTIPALTLPALEAPSDDMRYYYDVTGQTLDVASFVAGEPEYWQVAEPVVKPHTRIIRLAIEIGGMQSVTAVSLRNRGEAIIALINSLELQGHSVEVTVIRAFENFHSENYKFLIPIKQAGQALDVKRLQFIIGHPSFYRRCLFGLSELAQGRNIDQHATMTRNYQPEGYTYIGYQSGLQSTIKESLKWAETFAHSLTTEN